MSVREQNPWTRLSSRKIYENPWFSVRADEVIAPDGHPGTYHVVSAGRLAVGVVALWDDETIVLVGQYRYPVQTYSWEIPEGGGDFDIEPIESAKRELREETGIVASHWEYLGRTHTSNCFLDEVCHLFLATALAQGLADPGPEEILQTKRVPLEEAMAMAQDGRITDAITIVALFHVFARRRAGRDTEKAAQST
ncbi:NUDIX domain-containing protein [Candidatus Nitrospira bockiana]